MTLNVRMGEGKEVGILQWRYAPRRERHPREILAGAKEIHAERTQRHMERGEAQCEGGAWIRENQDQVTTKRNERNFEAVEDNFVTWLL